MYALISALALVTILIGITSAIGTADLLCVIICMALGTVIGELIRIDDGIEGAGDFIKSRLFKGKSSGRFTEGFITACIVFCVGSMTIMGSFEAGISGDYSIILAKSALDFVSSLMFAAAMGLGSSRILIWRECLRLFPERPLLGGGPDTLALRVDVHFSRFVEETGKTLRSGVDNAHNEYLGCLINTGLAGLAAYLCLLFMGARSWLKKSGKPLTCALGLGCLCYCVQGFFALGLPLVSPLFWLSLALLFTDIKNRVYEIM